MTIRLAIAAIAALALCACGGQSTSAAGTTETSATSAASSTATTSAASTAASTSTAAPTSASPAKGDKPSREFVVGKWGTDGDCTLAIDLRPDGTSDGPFGAWSYSDGVISFPEEPDFSVTVTVLDDKTMESHNGSSGKTTKMTRCP